MKPKAFEKNIPGFTGEASLGQSARQYRKAVVNDPPTEGRRVVPQYCYSPVRGVYCCWFLGQGWRCFRTIQFS